MFKSPLIEYNSKHKHTVVLDAVIVQHISKNKWLRSTEIMKSIVCAKNLAHVSVANFFLANT